MNFKSQGWRSGLPGIWVLGVFVVVAAIGEDCHAQIFRGRAARGWSEPVRSSNPGWRPAASAVANSADAQRLPVEETSLEGTPVESSGLGALLLPGAAGEPGAPNRPSGFEHRAGTPVPEHYYRGDWRRDPAFHGGTSGYPKYFGGFHSSHYDDLGIPNGDKGFRGNGIYWTPW